MSEEEDNIVKRTKVSRACDYCKKRKFKCSGKSPCNLCIKKKLECKFSIIDRRTIRRKNKKRKIKKELKIGVNGNNTTTIDNQTLNLLTRKTNIPVHYQPLVIFPLHKVGGDSVNNVEGGETGNNIVVKQEYFPELIYNSQGNLRYIGETSPLSFLFECRSIFQDKLGNSKFTDRECICPIIDEPDETQDIIETPTLPTRAIFNRIFEIYLININQVCYIFDNDYFTKNTIDFVYSQSGYTNCPPDKIALINMVIGIGLKYGELCQDPIVSQFTKFSAEDYFEFGLQLTNKYTNKNKLWVTEAYCLAYYYYQAVQQRNTAWLMLGTAIRNAQALGLHRKFINESFNDQGYIRHRRKLFKSLYVNDHIVSLLHGRPLLIDDYDYDDIENEDIYEINNDGEQIQCQKLTCLVETTKLSRISGNIVRNLYNHKLNGIIAEKLAIELKLWSLNLPSSIQIDKVVENSSSSTNTTIRDVKIPLLLVHLSQLYNIILLCRPFFMYIIFTKAGKRKKKPNKPHVKSLQEIAICNFGKATVKSSILVIQLVDYYVGYIQFLPMRVESYGVVHATFMASLIIGLSILYHELTYDGIHDDYSRINSMGYLNSSKRVFQFYSGRNIMSQRFYEVIETMQLELMEKFSFDMYGNKQQAQAQAQTQTKDVPVPVSEEQKHEVVKPEVQDKPKIPMFNYDDFIDNFGTLLPMATMGQSVDQYLSETPVSTTSSIFDNTNQPLDMFMYGIWEKS